MGYSNYSNKRRVPKISTRKSEPITTNFSKGVYTYKPNDTMTQDEIRLAENARFDRVGEYGTRKGFTALTDQPIGKYTIVSDYIVPTKTDGKEVKHFNYTALADATICAVGVDICKKQAGGYIVPRVNIKVTHTSGADVTVNTYSSCIPDSSLTTTWSCRCVVYFMDAPTVKNGDTIEIWVDAQSGSADDLFIGSATYGGQAKTLALDLYGCTAGSVTNVFEANIDGDKSILFTFNGTLYWRSSAGVVSAIRTLPAGTKKVRFCQNINKIRYVDGLEAPHLLTPTISGGVVTTWSDSAITPTDLKTGTTLNITMSNIMNGTADNLVYFATDPDTEAVWTYPYGYTYAKAPAFTTTATISGAVGTTLSVNISTISPSGIAVGDWVTGQGTGTAEVTAISGSTVDLIIVDTTPQTISSYDKFSTDFYQNFPAIKTGDPLTAMFNLGGVLYFMTRRNKYMMYSQTAESWSQSTSNAQSGTFSQESIVCDLNYAYYANDKGIYIFDGASESSLTENTIQNVYDAIPNKESITLDLYNNRLYVFYADSGTTNDHCLVYNTNLRVWEAFDSNTYVSATSARQNASNRFLCGHSKMGMLMLGESGNYADFGTPIAFNLETSYLHFGSTSQLKRITKWRPEFATTEQSYAIKCGYSLDFNDQVHYAFSIDLQRQVPILTDYVWDNPSDYGVPAIPTKHTALTQVNGEFYRCQIRYQHIAAFEPVIFRSHTLTVQTQRIR